ncbi:MAG TPA: TSUP family transporter, partial [Bacteroidia bacterium]|jgi:siroheme synthase-like protein|nr:TSUP family transporter [Bacteroidia bacterium]
MSTQTENKLFPVFLKLENFRVLIIGGGKVALEKVSAILNNSPNTQITLVATHVSDEIKNFQNNKPTLTIHQRSFLETDLEDVDFVISAVNNKDTSLLIKQLAQRKNILTNVADTPEQCDFYLGSIVQKGQVKIAISTNGKSPTIAKRLRETLDKSLPNEINEAVDNLVQIRKYLEGDFTQKVNQLNKITSVLIKEGVKQQPKISKRRIWLYSITTPILIFVGYLLCAYLPPNVIGGYANKLVQNVDSSILFFILAGFVAQMIDGALGMAYGVTATTFLLSLGVPPAASSASVHASEVFTSGVSGLMHLKFGNVNTKLFRSLLIPGVLGAILGAYILCSFQEYNYIIKPVVSIYTIILGLIIIFKALKKDKVREKIKRVFPLAVVGGFLDSIGGGGWGPIVSSTLIAGGRNARYTIGSVNLTEFFVSLASSITFFTLIGLSGWYIIVGLIIGGVIAAPIAAYLTNRIPTKTIMILVGIVVIIASLKRLFF